MYTFAQQNIIDRTQQNVTNVYLLLPKQTRCASKLLEEEMYFGTLSLINGNHILLSAREEGHHFAITLPSLCHHFACKMKK